MLAESAWAPGREARNGDRMNRSVTPDPWKLAEAVRAASLDAARRAYDDAAMSGLCEAGRIEAALDAIRALDVAALVREALP